MAEFCIAALVTPNLERGLTKSMSRAFTPLCACQSNINLPGCVLRPVQRSFVWIDLEIQIQSFQVESSLSFNVLAICQQVIALESFRNACSRNMVKLSSLLLKFNQSSWMASIILCQLICVMKQSNHWREAPSSRLRFIAAGWRVLLRAVPAVRSHTH